MLHIQPVHLSPVSKPVYNFAVEELHCYAVGHEDILVHNNACGNSIAAPIHHIATNKNWISTSSGGPWSPRFAQIFKKAGMTLEHPANKVRIPGHKGPHPEAYHMEIFRRLQAATDGLSGANYKAALLNELEIIANEAKTIGSRLNKLITGR